MKKKFITTVVFFIICSVISTLLIYVANNQFLQNAKLMGKEMVNSLVKLEEIAYISNYEDLLNTVVKEINKIDNINLNSKNTIYSKFEQVVASSKIDLYIVKNGEFYIYNNKITKSNLNYSETQWYNMAIEANGKMISSDLYNNENGEKVITFAIKANEKNDVVAANIYVDKMNNWANLNNLIEGINYYVCDSKGNLIYSNFRREGIEETTIREYVYKMFQEINKGQYEEKSSYLTDSNGEKRGIYYGDTSNGWRFIITIPYKYLLRGMDTILCAYYGTIVVFVILIAYLTIEERKARKRNILYNKITKALGDGYYALFLVNYEKGTYFMLKGTNKIRATVNKKGNYDNFIESIGAVIERETYKEFKDAFSLNNIKKLMEEKKVRRFGGDFKRIYNKEVRWINVQLFNVESKTNKNEKEVVIGFQDINEEKEKELEEIEIIKESIETTKQATESKNKFFANMSHDMRTPLNAIINLSLLVEQNIENKEKILNYIEKINISSKQLLDLINDILEIAKMEETLKNINKEEFNIEKLMKENLSVFEEQAKIQNKNLKIIYNIKNRMVSGDWRKVRQIINNILSNALKYTMTNGNISIEIKEIVGKFVSKYEFIITDDGIGMSKEFLEKIYDPFARETRFHSEEIGGTGLGMVVVNNNVQKLNGQIEIKSEPGKGSTFKVIIPLELADKMHKTEKKVIDNSDDILNGKNILVVEDNELNMEITTEILKMHGIKITTANNGKEAIDIFINSPEGKFDAILMDVQMPILNGYEATKKIRNLSRNDAKKIPIIATTANTFAEDINEAKRSGMNAHISKPIDFQELKKVLVQYLKLN